MIEEERMRKGLIFEENIVKTSHKRLTKAAVLSQHRPDVRDLVRSNLRRRHRSSIHRPIMSRSNTRVKVTNTGPALPSTILDKFFVKYDTLRWLDKPFSSPSYSLDDGKHS